MKKRAVVAMSGGVDSSVAAYLLLKKGYEVIGVTLKLFNTNKIGTGHYCGIEGANAARGVASKLGIPFYVLNYVKEFEKEVIQYFTEEYKNGRTPNPCIVCNEKIKFGSLLEKAKGFNAKYVATGHYVRIRHDKIKRRYILKKAKDKRRDQSYFLFSLPQRALKHAIFPLGDLSKEDVRKIAKKIGIKVHNKPGSQEICFIPDNDYKKFLTETKQDINTSGSILNTKGEILGKHKGISFYTVGQRKGLGVARKGPLYVLSINKKENTIVVGETDDTYFKELIAKNVNWIAINKIKGPIRTEAQTRYNEPSARAKVSRYGKNKIRVVFDKAQKSPAPGQAVVFYNREIVLGGAVIEETIA